MKASSASIALLILLLANGAGASWNQLAGDASRTGKVLLPPGPVDVIANFTYEGEPTMLPYMPHALWTRHGLWAMLFEDNDAACGYWLVTDLRVPEPVRSDVECRYDIIETYFEPADIVTTCNNGALLDEPVIGARDAATMEVAWSITGSQLGFADEAGGHFFYCHGSALDEATGILYVPVVKSHGLMTFVVGNDAESMGTRLVAVQAATGEIIWNRPLVRGTAQGGVVGLVAQQTGMGVHDITLTTTGIVITGRTTCAACQFNSAQSVVMWTDRAGRQMGYYEASTAGVATAGDDPTGRTGAASQYAVAKGPLAALAIGSTVAVINPETTRPVASVPLEAVEPVNSWIFWPANAWIDDRILIGLPHSMSAYDADSLAYEWSWSDGLSWLYRDLAVLPSGEVLLLLGDIERGVARVTRIDSATGEVVARIPLSVNATPRGDGIFYASFSAADDALLVVDPYGTVNVLGRADPALVPAVAVSDLFPASGAAIELSLPPRNDIARYVVQWGDGSEETVDVGGTMAHAYAGSGKRDVLATAVLRDGRTATFAAVVDVGGTPPVELTALQQAFSPEWQNWTFFVIGTLITVVGLAITVGRHRRRFARLERELAAVEGIRVLSVADPRGAVLALKSYRDRLPDHLARRRIDDSQYQILDIRSARLLKVLRTRLFAPYDARVSTRYHRLLDAAFEDAILQPSERLALVSALESEEALLPAERAAVVALLDDFTTSRPDLH